MVALVDRGFYVQDLFLVYHVTVAIPPFTKGETHFTKVQVEQAKTISRARIHVERAIGRLKEFKLLSHELPLNMLDLADYIWIIAGAITNLQPSPVIECHELTTEEAQEEESTMYLRTDLDKISS